MKVLIACEESQTVCKAFMDRGHEAYSCDLQECSGDHPEWHFKADVFEVIKMKEWELMIAHPPCTFLSVSGAKWYYHPEDKELPIEQRRPHPKYPNRAQDREEAFQFFMQIAEANIPKIAIENPVGIISTRWRKPSQVVQPWMFGDEATKTTCLWLKGLPKLKPSLIVGKGERTVFASGKSHPKWYAEALAAKTKEERQRLRSKTFPGMAWAMANQWG